MPNPIIPSTIIVHIGAPDEDGLNVSETFASYIKNVASSEIYPTWPEQAIRANIYAQISVALNRVYTEYYRSRGYAFDITSSPAYDQNYVYQRDIFDNISAIVDDIFNSYLRRRGFIEPLYAQFCDGVKAVCGGLAQWGTVELANQGQNALEIVRSYYGEDIELVTDVPIDDFTESAPPVPLREGDTGRDVELTQRRINRISANFPGIPKINPADGFFDKSTTDAVRKFQEVFGLTVDGFIGRRTWYTIQLVYNAVKNVFSLNSEGIRLSDVSTQFSADLRRGSEGEGVLVLQYYLQYIATFVPSVRTTTIDGSFGPATEEAVRSFQRTYGFEENGIVDRAVWDKMQNIYFGLIAGVLFEFREGTVLPFPGRILRVGTEGDDVRALQSYLAYISRTYSDIPAVTPDGRFGEQTAQAVQAFQIHFNLPTTSGRVNSNTWDAIVSVYEDLYYGSAVQAGQFAGRELALE